MSGALLALAASVSGAQPLSATIGAGQIISGGTTADINFSTNTVTPTGGVAPYTYAWSWINTTGTATKTFSGSSTAVTVTPRFTGATAGTTNTGELRCQVTDSASNVFTTTTAYYEYERI